MAKARFRDVKQGRIPDEPRNKKRNGKKQTAIDAGLRDRFKAFITDSFMLLMPLMYLVFYVVFDGREGFAAHKLLGWLYILIPYIIITTIFIAKSGQTPGMRAYEIKCVDSRTGAIPSTGAILLRQILGVWDFFLFTWILQFFRRDHRTLHEILSGTRLIRVEETSRERRR